jgi:hypothetical protein
MGLKNGQKNYVHIVDIDLVSGSIKIRIYRNRESRSNPTQFDKHIDDSISCGNLLELLDGPSNPMLSVRENLWTIAYEALKCEPPYNQDDWVDVIEEKPNTKIEIVIE